MPLLVINLPPTPGAERLPVSLDAACIWCYYHQTLHCYWYYYCIISFIITRWKQHIKSSHVIVHSHNQCCSLHACNYWSGGTSQRSMTYHNDTTQGQSWYLFERKHCLGWKPQMKYCFDEDQLAMLDSFRLSLRYQVYISGQEIFSGDIHTQLMYWAVIWRKAYSSMCWSGCFFLLWLPWYLTLCAMKTLSASQLHRLGETIDLP